MLQIYYGVNVYTNVACSHTLLSEVLFGTDGVPDAAPGNNSSGKFI